MTEITFPISIGPELESYVAKLLDQAGIPNFIWGDPVLDILGTPSLPPYSGWAIPDRCIEAAAKALDEAKFPPCTQGRDCTVFQMISNPYPDYHWHTDHFYPTEPGYWSCGVFLYRKSRLFWTFPDPPIGPSGSDNPYYMLTSDPRIKNLNPAARGRQSDDPAFYPVKMPTPARYLEAMFLLDLRDLEGTRTSVHWQIEQNDIINDYESNVDFNELVEPFRQWAEIGWDEKADDPAGHRLKHEIYVEMKRNNQLPPAEEPGSDWGCRPLEERLRECNVSLD